MKKLAIFMEDGPVNGIDWSYPEEGNPGIGGTEFQFACLIKLLSQCVTFQNQIELIVLRTSNSKINLGVRQVYLNGLSEVAAYCMKEKIDMLIYRPHRGADLDFYQIISQLKIKLIPWIHITPNQKHLDILASLEQISVCVFVGRDQRMRIIDHALYNKSTTIFNTYPWNVHNRQVVDEKQVTFVGALVEQKGFHILAESWQSISRLVPDVTLHVFGSSRLYDRKRLTGKFGLADKNYETKFMPYLMTNDEELMKNVHFEGINNLMASDVFARTGVGVVNPSGQTENCPVSAIEFQVLGIPIVTSKKYGMRDMVINNETGFLCNSKRSLRRKIVLLLTDNTIRNRMSKNASEYAIRKFHPKIFLESWLKLLLELESQGKRESEAVNFDYWVHKISRQLRKFGIIPKHFPIVEELKSQLHRFFARNFGA